MPGEVTARAPAKVILFGEHAVNRGQMAIATSVGLYATCTLRRTDSPRITFRSDAGPGAAEAAPEDLFDLARAVDGWRATEDYDAIRRLAAADFYAPHKYIVASALRDLGDTASPGFEGTFASQIPPSCGLGSGGAAFAALATALNAIAVTPGHDPPEPPSTRALDAHAGRVSDRQRIADWAHRGDVIAHGGVASRLDTQTSLCGGAIRFTVSSGLGESIPVHQGLCTVLGNTGVTAATSAVNSQVRHWLAEDPVGRMRYFDAIGLLARAALAPLAAGDWPELGRLMTLNQLALEKIGVSSAELERLIAAALAAGALGAKLAGSGGGGIMIALCTPDSAPGVAEAITAAGGTPLLPPLAVAGAAVVTPP